MRNGPGQQNWRPQQYNNNQQQEGSSKPAYYTPYNNKKKFVPQQQTYNNNFRQNYQQGGGFQPRPQSNFNNQDKTGPNLKCNQDNCTNKKFAKQALIKELQDLRIQGKPDFKEKGKAKIVQFADASSSLQKRIETLDNFKARGFSVEDNIERNLAKQQKEIFARIDEDEEMVSLGDEDETFHDLGDTKPYYGVDYNQYDNFSNSEQITNKHTVMTTPMKLGSFSSKTHSRIINSTVYNKILFVLKCVKSSNLKKSLKIEKVDNEWIIDSGASHHITYKLSDFTEYKPYAIPEAVTTANKDDNVVILGEGSVFFDTETDNGQTHRIRLDQVCYIPNGL